MVSEVDIRDWEYLIKDARESVDHLDDYSRMTVGVDPVGPRNKLYQFINEVESTLKGKQPQVAALFKEKK